MKTPSASEAPQGRAKEWHGGTSGCTYYLGAKRVIDLILAGLGLVVLSPLMIGISGLVLASMGFPILYRGRRVGRLGRPFSMLKFRTMRRDADRIGSSVTRLADARITRVGRLLRSTKLDELPQLWNVLSGDMSLVGPRPEVPEIVATYSDEMLRSLLVRPGVTSIASLWLRNEVELLARASNPDSVYVNVVVPLKVRLGLAHVDRQSLAFDYGVLCRTAFAVVSRPASSQAERVFLDDVVAQIATASRTMDATNEAGKDGH